MRECTDPGHPPALNFVIKKIAQGELSLGRNFYQKYIIFVIFSYLSPYFYTDNVKILLKRTDRLKNLSTTQNFARIAQGACRYCIAPRRRCILISSLLYNVHVVKYHIHSVVPASHLHQSAVFILVISHLNDKKLSCRREAARGSCY